MSSGVGCRHGLDPVLLWLWHRPVATVLIGPLAWESSYAPGATLKRTKQNSLFRFSFFLSHVQSTGCFSIANKQFEIPP